MFTEIMTTLLQDIFAKALKDQVNAIAVSKDDKYLNYSPGFNLEQYSSAHPVSPSIPYEEIINFIKPNKPIHIINDNTEFFVEPLNNLWKEISQEGFHCLKNDGRIKENEPAIRLYKIENTDNCVKFHVNKTYYHEQAKSNLILDYQSSEYKTTLRTMLIQAHGHELPPLDSKYLSNNVGIAIIVFYKNTGEWLPYMVRRAVKMGVFPGGLHCTASGVAKWPKADEEITVDKFFSEHMYSELEEEVGLLRADLYDFKLVSVCREFARGGKPQIFFAAKTDLSQQDLVNKRKGAHKLLVQSKQRTEIDERWFYPERITSASQLLSDIIKYKVTLEGVAALYYGQNYITNS